MKMSIFNVALATLCLFVFCKSASADFEFLLEVQLNSPGTSSAVSFDGQNIYVVKFDGTVDRFDSSFNFLNSIEFPLPFFGNGRSIDIDRTNGNLLFLSSTTELLTEFTPELDLVFEYNTTTNGNGIAGVVLDPVTNTTWSVGTSSGEARHFSRNGDFLGGFPVDVFDIYNSVAIDWVNRTLLLLDPAPDTIYEYTFDGEFVGRAFEAEPGDFIGLGTGFPNGMFYDSETAMLYVISSQGDLAIWQDKSRIGGDDGFVSPASYNVVRGIELTGSIAAFSNSDDTRSTYNPGFTLNGEEAPVWLEFNANAPQASEFFVESRASTPNLEYTVEAFNWDTLSFDVVGVVAESFNVDQVISTPIVADHVDTNGAVRSRVGWRTAGFTINFPWVVRVDQVGWNTN